MRRTVAFAVIVLAACSKQETPRTDSPTTAAPAPAAPAPLTSADVAGTWDAKGMLMDKDTVVVTFTMNLTDTGEGTSIVFPSGVKVVSTKRQVSGDSMVLETDGFKSQVRKGQNVTSTRSVLRMKNGQMVGVLTGKYGDGTSRDYRITATKKP